MGYEMRYMNVTIDRDSQQVCPLKTDHASMSATMCKDLLEEGNPNLPANFEHVLGTYHNVREKDLLQTIFKTIAERPFKNKIQTDKRK